MQRDTIEYLSQLHYPLLDTWIQRKREELKSILASMAKNKKTNIASETSALDLLCRFNITVDNQMLDDALAAGFDSFVLLAGEKRLISLRKPVISVVPVEKDTTNYDWLPDRLNYTSQMGKNVETNLIRTSYHPTLTKLPEKETGLEQKLGGNVPFFVSGEQWPKDKKGIPYAFFGQFVDPRYVGELTQIWIGNVENTDYPEVLVKKYPVTAVDSQIILPVPNNVPNDGLQGEKGIIEEWKCINEINVYELQGDESDLIDRIESFQLHYDHFKIGGFGYSTQDVAYTEDYQNIYAKNWGDSGYLHISRDGKTVTGDMS